MSYIPLFRLIFSLLLCQEYAIGLSELKKESYPPFTLRHVSMSL